MIAWAIKGPNGINMRTVSLWKRQSWINLIRPDREMEESKFQARIVVFQDKGYRAVQVEVKEVNAAGQSEGTSEPGLSEAGRSERADAATSPDRPAAPAAPNVLADRLEQYIPDGDGYNSEYAETLTAAVAALRQSGAWKDVERYQLLRAGINLPRYGHGIGNRLADAALDAELDKALKERTE